MSLNFIKGHVYAARVNLSGDDLVSLISLKGLENDRVLFYWETGPQYASGRLVDGEPAPGEFQLLHDYGKPDEDDDNWWDNVDRHHLKTYYPFYPVGEPTANQNGLWEFWVGPNGRIYPVMYGSHDGTARKIVLFEEDKLMRGRDAREHLLKTWVYLSEHKYVVGRWELGQPATVTQAQFSAIRRIMDAMKEAGREDWQGYEDGLDYRSVVPR